MAYASPTGYNGGSMKDDGYGMSLVAVAVIYSVFFYTTCFYLWYHRQHAILRMRKIGLALASLLVLHVYLFMVMIAYSLNGTYPCSVEFWCMSIYLPIGIGLFQAQNQQLLIVSREQCQLLQREDYYKPLFPKAAGRGRMKYCIFRFKAWWNATTMQGKYEGFVFVGVCIQLSMTLAIYCLSRKFSSYGIVSNPVSPAQCRRGWEWVPSILWQFLWNFFFGPYLIWKIRMIHDIYHWRLQTIMAIVAGLPGTPLWLAALYSPSFAPINKYWIPAMWFLPGLFTMELTTLIFPLIQMRRHNRTARETAQALADFENKHINQMSSDGSASSASILTRSTDSRRSGRMYSMESLEECLNTNYDGLQIYSSVHELNGENIIFLVKVLSFQKQWDSAFGHCTDTKRATVTLYRAALNIFVTLIEGRTAKYPINLESPIYHALNAMFGEATELVASKRTNSMTSTPSVVTPWDEPADESLFTQGKTGLESVHMVTMLTTPPIRRSSSNDSRERIVPLDGALPDLDDPLVGFKVPKDFGRKVFDDAYKSIKYMVWCETWQRYMEFKRSSGPTIRSTP